MGRAILCETLRERGHDLNILLKWGLPRFVEESSPLPYFFAAPQLSEGQTWVDREADVIALLDNLIASEADEVYTDSKLQQWFVSQSLRQASVVS